MSERTNQTTISIIDDEIISGGKTLDLSGNPKAAQPWHPIDTVPSTGMMIVRGADGIERQYSGGWIEGKNSPPVVPKEWRYMIEEVDL